MDGRFVAYYRVSTAQQGRSGLGLEAQRAAVLSYLDKGSWALTAEFTEMETGKSISRPQLAAALAECRLTGAVLIVAKLDRLARNHAFLMNLLAGTGEGGVVFCDLPKVPPGPMGRFFLQQMSSVAELEAGMISERTKAALKASKKKLGGYRGGPKVDGAKGRAAQKQRAEGFASRVRPLATRMRADGMSLRQIAAALADRGVQTSRGGAWTAAAVKAILPPTA